MRSGRLREWIRTPALSLVTAVMFFGAAGATAGPGDSETHWRIVPSAGPTDRHHSRMLHLPAGKFDSRAGMLEIPGDLRLQESETARPGVPWIVQFQRAPGRTEHEELEGDGHGPEEQERPRVTRAPERGESTS